MRRDSTASPGGGSGGGFPGGDLAMAGVLGLVLVPGLVLWVAGGLGALLIHGHWPPAPVSVAPALTFGLRVHWADPGASWPPSARGLVPSAAVVYPIAALMIAALFGLVLALRRRFGGGGHPGNAHRGNGLARRGDLRASLSAKAVRERGAQVRPSLGRRGLRPAEVGLALGRDAASGQALWASLEDSFLVLGPPRSGKGIHLVIPGVIAAPGPAVVTSTRPDVLAHTAGARPGPVEVFDPQGDTAWPNPLRWSPVTGCEDALVAILRAEGFATGAGFSGGTTDADYWTGSAAAVIRCYLHAAALGGRSMIEILDWAYRPSHPEPVRILRGAADAAPGWADALANLAGFEPETRDGIWGGVQRAFDCFADPRVLAAVTPDPGEAFDAESFLAERGTLYVLGSARAQLSVAPLISALVEDVTERAHRLANASAHGRLDPPLSLWLDEAANIAPLPSLPYLLSAGGGSGISTVVVLQSLAQARARWGEHQAAAMWDASTVRVVLGGLGNADDLAAISRLAGEVDEETLSTSTGPGGASRSTSLRSVPVLAPERLRSLAPDRAVVLHRRTPPVEAVIAPWWDQACASDVRASLDYTARIRAQRR